MATREMDIGSSEGMSRNWSPYKGMWNHVTAIENNLVVFQKLDRQLSYGLVVPLLNIYLGN